MGCPLFDKIPNELEFFLFYTNICKNCAVDQKVPKYLPVEAGVGIAAVCEVAELFINETRLLRLEALGMVVVGAKSGDAPDTPGAPG